MGHTAESTTGAAVTTTVTLDLRRPFDAGSLLDFLRRRAVTGLERADATSYSRTLRLPSGSGVVSLDLSSGSVEARFWLSAASDLATAVERCRRLLDLDRDPAVVDHHLGTDPTLRPSVEANPGLRVPGHVDGFEVAVRAIVGQQISVAGARTILGRLVSEYGEEVTAQESLTHLFPSPGAMSQADPEHLPMPRSRARALVALAAAVAGGEIMLDRSVDPTEVRRSLLGLPGIGPWTADYIALRALGDPDVFLGTDLGVRHGMARMGLTDAGPEVVARWSPWRSYALMHVWKSLEGTAA